MGKFRQVGFLYALIGLFVVGGLYVISAKTAHADITDSYLTGTSGGINITVHSGQGATSGLYFYTTTLIDDYNQTTNPYSISTPAQDGNWVLYDCPDPNPFVLTHTVPDSRCYAIPFVIAGGLVTGTYYASGYYGNYATTTRFISVSPVYGSNVATGTVTITVTGFVTQDDLNKGGGQIQLTSVANQLDPQINGGQAVTSTHINTAGVFTVTGTSTIGYASIWNDAFVLSTDNSSWLQNFLSNANLLPSFAQSGETVFTATSTYFSIGMLSPFQQALFNQTVARRAFESSTTAAYDLSVCSPIAASGNAIGMSFNSSFSLDNCIYNLVVPSGQGMSEIGTDAQDGFLTAAPWGYLVRMINLVNSGTSTDIATSVPALSYTFPASMPVFGSTTIAIDVYGAMTQAADLENNTFVSSTDGKNIWQVFGPLVKLFFAILLVLKIVSDITGIDFNMEQTQDTRVNGSTPDQTYAYKEKLYKMSKRK